MFDRLRAFPSFLAALGGVWRLMVLDCIRRAPHKRAQRQGWKRDA
jgi:hypothetical protein